MLPFCCQSPSKYACNPHKHWVCSTQFCHCKTYFRWIQILIYPPSLLIFSHPLPKINLKNPEKEAHPLLPSPNFPPPSPHNFPISGTSRRKEKIAKVKRKRGQLLPYDAFGLSSPLFSLSTSLLRKIPHKSSVYKGLREI